MVTAEELTVAIRSEGVSDTQQDLEGVERSMEDTAESAGESADNLQEFSERFEGAMSAAVAALAIGAAGLATQVPVLGEAFAGLGAIVSAVAFQIDGVLRPALQPITNFFFEVANSINEADGAMGDLIGIVGTFLGLAVTVIPVVAQIGSVLGQWGSATAGVSAILSTLTSGISSFVSGVTSFVAGSLAAAAALGVLLGTLGVAALEVTGVLDAVTNLGNTIANQLPAWARDGFTAFVGTAFAPFAALGALILGFVEGTLEGGLMEGVDRAGERFMQVFNIVVGALARSFGRIGSLFSDILDAITGFVADALDSVDEFIDGIISGASDLVSGFLDGIMSLAEDAFSALTSFAGELAEWAGALAQDAFDWGVSLMQGFLDGILSLAETVVKAVQSVVNGIIETINTTIENLPKEIKSRVDVQQFEQIAFDTTFGAGDVARGNPSEQRRPRPTGSRASASSRAASLELNTRLDGREVSEDTGRYRADPGRRRGL